MTEFLYNIMQYAPKYNIRINRIFLGGFRIPDDISMVKGTFVSIAFFGLKRDK